MKDYAELKALIEKRGVHPVFGDVGEGWNLEQNSHELATFLVRMQELGVQSCLEIGTGYKGGLSRFLAADMGWDVTSVDVQDYGHKFAGVTYIIDEKVEGKFDLVFIDGDHNYNAVKWDYVIYGRMATKVIAMHDVAGLRNCEGALGFWRDINQQPGAHEIIATEKQAGIGFIDLIEQHELVYNS